LLEIFDFYVKQHGYVVVVEDEGGDEGKGKGEVKGKKKYVRPSGEMEWMTLPHVCQRWRRVIFQSPLRLNLRLLCKPLTPARDTLDIWPPFPLIIRGHGITLSGSDNIIAGLERNDRVSQIDLTYLDSSLLGYLADLATILNPFPELTHLNLGMRVDDEAASSIDEVPILPDSFLGGTAPRLRSLYFWGIPFPGLPKLLLSATHLVKLDLFNISHSGYIPPEVMATSLSALTGLECTLP
jgi:hypothetical protein